MNFTPPSSWLVLRSDGMNLLNQILFFVLFMYCVILHEVAHGYAARISGDDTAYLSGRLTLDPLAHIDLMELLFCRSFFTSLGLQCCLVGQNLCP